MKFELIDSFSQKAVIRVVGIGERGIRAVRHMRERGIDGVEFDLIEHEVAPPDGALMCSVLHRPDVPPNGDQTSEAPEVKGTPLAATRMPAAELLVGCDMVVLVTDLGLMDARIAVQFAEASRYENVLTLAVVSRPFAFEGMARQSAADDGYRELLPKVDSLVLVPIEEAVSELTRDWSPQAAFTAVDQALHYAVQGITDLITRPGLIGIDFADLRTVATNMGKAMSGTASATGEHRARDAAQAVIEGLRSHTNLLEAIGWWVNISGGPDLAIAEFDQVGAVIDEFAGPNAILATGLSIDPELQDQVRVSILVTGLDGANEPLDYQVPTIPDYEIPDDEIPAFLRRGRGEV